MLFARLCDSGRRSSPGVDSDRDLIDADFLVKQSLLASASAAASAYQASDNPFGSSVHDLLLCTIV
jgi:hypothetical protein